MAVRMKEVPSESSKENRAETTKHALLDAAIKLFGDKGYDNTTVRDLIAEAGVNLAAINYHFGDKEGLRFAAIDHLANSFHTEGPGATLQHLSPDMIGSMSSEEARATLREILRSFFIRSAKGKQMDVKSRYIQRELIQGGKPTELFFEKVFSFQFSIMRALVSRITGEPVDSEKVRIRAVNLIAQSVFLNLARPLVLMALEWENYSEEKSEDIADAFWLYHE